VYDGEFDPSLISKNMKVGHRNGVVADARCPAGYQCRCPTFCRKPDSGNLHHPAKSGEEIDLELYLNSPHEHIQNGRLYLLEIRRNTG
jgi:hypothetical protein